MKKLYGNQAALRAKQAERARIDRARNAKARHDLTPEGIEHKRLIDEYRAAMAPKLAAAEAERLAKKGVGE